MFRSHVLAVFWRVLLTSVLLIPTAITAAQKAPRPEKRATSAAYMRAVVKSLAREHRALRAVNDAADKPSLVDRMTTIRNANVELGLCELLVQDFASDANEQVAASAAGLIAGYEGTRRSLRMSLAIYENIDRAKSEDDLTGVRSRIAEAKSLYQQSELVVIDASMIAFMTGIVPDPRDPEKHTALAMTAGEKEEITKLIEDEFGQAIVEQSENDTASVKVARLLLEKFREFPLARSGRE